MAARSEYLVVAVDGGPGSQAVLTAGHRIADTLHLPLTAMYVAPPGQVDLPAIVRDAVTDDAHAWELPDAEGSSPVGLLARRADQPGVFAEILGRGRTAYTVAQRAAAPVIVVPPLTSDGTPLTRVAVAVNGSQQVQLSTLHALRRFVSAGVEIVAVHIFQPGHVPPFWDQPHHAVEVWAEEFAARVGGTPSEVITRSGRVREHVLDAAVSTSADLIMLPWDQQVAPGGTSVVRECLAESPIPIMVVPGA